MSCQYETVRCLTQPKMQILASSVSPQRLKQMGLLGRHLALLLGITVAQLGISSNRNTLLLRSKNRFKASKSIEAQASGNHLNSSRTRLYLHHSNSPLPLQTRRTFPTQLNKLVQGLTQGDDRTETLAASISWRDSMPYARLVTP